MPNNNALAMYSICRQCPHSGECEDWEQVRWDNECPINSHNRINIKPSDVKYSSHDNYYGGDCFDDGATSGIDGDGDGDCTD